MAAYTNWTFEVDWTGNGFQDMTSRVEGAIVVTRGRPAEGSDIQPGTLAVTLDNADNQLTAGNPASAVNVQLGRSCRLRETVGGIVYDRFTGDLTDIDPGSWVESGDRTVRLTFTDRLDRLQRGQEFVSTLAEHIKLNGGSVLIGYYPMGEASAPLRDVTELGILPATLGEALNANSTPGTVTTDRDRVTYQGGTSLPGDDLSGVSYLPTYGVTEAADFFTQSSTYHTATTSSTWSVPSGEWLTVACWVNPIELNEETFFVWELALAGVANSTVTLIKTSQFVVGSTPLAWRGDLDEGAAFIRLDSTMPTVSDHPTLIAMRVKWSTGATELWIGGADPVTGTVSGTISSFAFDTIRLGRDLPGVLSHVQVYRSTGGGAVDYTRAMHLAQLREGFNGLERQSTGERITTLAQYAGLASADYHIDPGLSQMQRAELGGRTPYDAMGDAFRSDNGDLFARGDNALVFRDRSYRYNQVAAATGHRVWISDGMQHRVDGPLINSQDVSIDGGVTVRSTDSASVDAVGVKAGPPLTINVLQATEAADAAAYRTMQYSEQRTRVTLLPIDLLHQTAAVRHAVLSLDIGDRFDKDDMPASYPAGADKLIVEGYTEFVGQEVRRIDFVTSPVLGLPAGTAARWFKLDTPGLQRLDSGNKLAY